jgi:VanZ family protein
VNVVARRALVPIALMALIFFLSAQPDLDSGLGTLDLVLRKLVHLAEYAALVLLWAWALRPGTDRPLAFAAAIALLYAISDEYHQGLIEGRNGSPVDVAIDALGVGIGAVLLRYDPRVRSAVEAGTWGT